MKKLLLLLICGFPCFLLGSCRSSGWNRNGIEVTIDGDGRFPAFLVGRWIADKGGWEFVFEPDGTISSAVVSLGRVRMKPGQVTTTNMILGGKGLFEPGRWAVQYSQAKRELIVEIAIKYFRVELGDNVVQGQTWDFFVGLVSSDGQLWWADRFSFPEYIIDTKKYPNYKLPVDPALPHRGNDGETLIFRKVTESK